MTPPERTLGHTPSWPLVAHLRLTYRLTVCSIPIFVQNFCLFESFSKESVFIINSLLFYILLILLVKPLKVHQDLQDMTVTLGQPIKLHCEIYPGNVPGRWYRNGQLIQPSDRINIIHRNKYVIAFKLSSAQTSFTQILTSIIFQGPPSRNSDQLPS